jgi:hypothetical protein
MRATIKNLYICKTRKNSFIQKQPIVKQLYYSHPGREVLESENIPFELTKSTKERLFSSFQKRNNKSFKFVMFEYDKKPHIYVVLANKYNKHSICLLKGIIDYTKSDHQFDEMRRVYNTLIRLKHSSNIYKRYLLRQELNKQISLHYPCLPVISAGHGTILDDGSILLNNRSGHYSPSMYQLKKAVPLFKTITSKMVHTEEYIR